MENISFLSNGPQRSCTSNGSWKYGTSAWDWFSWLLSYLNLFFMEQFSMENKMGKKNLGGGGFWIPGKREKLGQIKHVVA